jgi:predicted DNA-binding transcriptional regulator YafY
MSETLIRQWEMLRLIPRAPRKIATAEIEQKLRDDGFDVNRRTIQRDLQYLSGPFPLVVDDRHKPFGWSWMREAEPIDLPGMDLHVALAFRLASEHLERLLPAPSRGELAPYFKVARGRLDALQDNALRAWQEKTRVVHTGPARTPPNVAPEVLEDVQTALFEERRLMVSYQARDADAPTRYEVNPLGLVCRDEVTYLVATIGSYEDVRQLCLHRMSDPELTDRAASAPVGFELDAYVRSGAFGFLVSDEVVRLEARFDPQAAATLLESPVGERQAVEVEPDGRVRVEADVRDTTALRTWLLGYGALVEVLGPERLREELTAQARAMVAAYGA